MLRESQQTFVGKVTEIFAHRFVLNTDTGTILADLGPRGCEQVALRKGDTVVISGELKPSELKVRTIKRGDCQPIAIEHQKPHPDEPHADGHRQVDLQHALKTARDNGFSVVGSQRRKPKHFEILGRDSAGDFVELHIDMEGSLRSTRSVDDADPKWAAQIRNES